MTGVLDRLDFLASNAVGTGAWLVRESEGARGVALEQQPGGKIDAEDASLDFVIADVALLDDETCTATMTEWRRVLKPGGRTVLVVQPDTDEIAKIERLLMYEAGVFFAEKNSIDGDPDGRIAWIGTRDFDRAMRRHFSRILDECSWAGRPNNWRDELRFDLASLMLHTGEGKLAADFYRDVLKQDPESTDARVGLALSLALLRDWDDAREILTEVLEVDPDHGLAAAWLKRAHQNAEIPVSDPAVLEPAARRPR